MNRTFWRVLLMIGSVVVALLGNSGPASATPVTFARSETGVDYVSAGVGGLGGGSGTITVSGVAAGAVCGDGVVGSGELCDDGNLVDGDGCDGNCAVQCPKWEVDFSLLSAANDVGALQLSVDYSIAPGDFAGAGPTVECVSYVVGVPFAADDDEAARRIGLGWATESGFSGPQSLATCIFNATGFPGPEGFQLSVVDASDIDLNTSSVSVGVDLRETAGRFDCAAYCGDGFTQIDGGEACDDGNTVNTDGCTNECQAAVCGDGFIREGIEQCDDGNLVNADGCDVSCAFPCPKWEIDFSLADASAGVGAMLISVDYEAAGGGLRGQRSHRAVHEQCGRRSVRRARRRCRAGAESGLGHRARVCGAAPASDMHFRRQQRTEPGVVCGQYRGSFRPRRESDYRDGGRQCARYFRMSRVLW